MIHKMQRIPFFRPDLTELEIAEAADVLRSGWITTGEKTKLLETRLQSLLFHHDRGKDRCLICLNSATAAEEMNLRVWGIRPGDEVLLPAFTYTATASAAIHCGAVVRFVDIQKDGDPATHAPEMDYDRMSEMLTEKTKAVIPVDYAGILCHYEKIHSAVSARRALFHPIEEDGTVLGSVNHRNQTSLGRIAVISDSAHALGSVRKQEGKQLSSAEMADFASYSFHAVKNLTTAEGGAAVWRQGDLYQQYSLLANHGQSRDAGSKSDGNWEYDIIGPWYKYNMTDVAAAIGLGQLQRYTSMLERRREIVKRYDEMCDRMGLFHLNHTGKDHQSNCHLYPVRVPGIGEEKRNDLIRALAGLGVQTNVHYKPLPMMTAYQTGQDVREAFPNSYDYYRNLITLPLYSTLTDDSVEYICNSVRTVL